MSEHEHWFLSLLHTASCDGQPVHCSMHMSENLKLCSRHQIQLPYHSLYWSLLQQAGGQSPHVHSPMALRWGPLVSSIICLCGGRQSSTCDWVVRHLSITPVTGLSVTCQSPICDWVVGHLSKTFTCDLVVSHLSITHLWLGRQSSVIHLPVTEPSVTCQSPVNHLLVIEPSVTCQSPTCDWAVSHPSITYLWLGCQSPVKDLSITYLWLGWLVGGMGLHPLQSSVLQKLHLFTHLRILPFQFSDACLQSRHSGCPATLLAFHFILEISQLQT